MARVKGAMMTRKRRNKVLKAAKGYWGSKSKHFKMAKQAVMKSGNYAYIGRKQKKRDFRALWITRISAQAKVNGMNYSTLMHGLKVAGMEFSKVKSPVWVMRSGFTLRTSSSVVEHIVLKLSFFSSRSFFVICVSVTLSMTSSLPFGFCIVGIALSDFVFVLFYHS